VADSGGGRASDCFDRDVVCVGGEGFDVCCVAGENYAAGFCEGDDDRVNCRSVSCLSAKLGGASGGSFGDNGFDDAGLEEPVRLCVASAVALERFDEYDGWGDRWPESLVAKSANERKGSCRAFGETADTSAVDDQHVLAGLVELTIADASHDRVGSRLLTRCWFADFGDEFGEVLVGCVKYVATFEFGTHGNLE